MQAAGLFESSDAELSDEVIREGILRYSTKYFVGAIQNEFAGYEEGPENAVAALTALKAIGKQRFDRAEFTAALVDIEGQHGVSVDKLLRLLFFAGAIGNSDGRQGKAYMQFYHRRDESEIYLKGLFILHNALIHAWGLRRSGESRTGAPERSPTAPEQVASASRTRNKTRAGGRADV